MKKFYLIITIIGLMLVFSMSAFAQTEGKCSGKNACKNMRVRSNINGTDTVAWKPGCGRRNCITTNQSNSVRVNNLANLEAIRNRNTNSTQTQSSSITFEGNDEPLGSLNRIRNANRNAVRNGRTEPVGKNETITVGGNRSRLSQRQSIVQNGGQGSRNQ